MTKPNFTLYRGAVIASALLNELLTFKYKTNVKNSEIRLGRSERNC